MRDWSKVVYPRRRSKKPVKTYDYESHEAFRRLHEERAEKAQKRAEKLEGDRKTKLSGEITNEELIDKLRNELSAKNDETDNLRMLARDSQQHFPYLESVIKELRDEKTNIEEYVEKAKFVYKKLLKRWERKLDSKDKEIREKQNEIDRLISEKKLEEERRMFLDEVGE